MTFDQYLKVLSTSPKAHQRLGQLAMNVLGGVRPDLYEAVTFDKSIDPFYEDEKLGKFFVFLQENW